MKCSILAALLVCAPLLPAATFTTGQAARAEIGQFFFNSDEGLPSNQVLAGPSGVAWANNLLFVADGNILAANDGTDLSGNAIAGNRVLTFFTNLIPDAYADLSAGSLGDSLCPLCGFSAANVLGQGDYHSYLPGLASTGTPATAPNVSGTSSMNSPTAVATDGTSLVVADTKNNRVLIWKTLPTTLNQAPDLVLGQPGFTTSSVAATTASTVRAPMGVWIQGGKLFVSDTFDNRVLIWNTFPTANNQPADLVLGEPNFTAVSNPSFPDPVASATLMYNPVGVTSDGTHLFVSDLGYNRVLIWNTIPTTNDVPADVVVGQPNMTFTAFNNTPDVCGPNGTDVNGNPTYAALCERSLGQPRYALSDGTRLFIADSGNDRVLIYNSIPTANGAAADVVLGQADFVSDIQGASQSSLFTSNTTNSSGTSDTLATPISLAYDGENLYIADLYDRRVSIFTPGDVVLAQESVLNTASHIIRQEGYVAITGTIVSGDTVTVTINSVNYVYTVQKTDTLATIASGIITKINGSNNNAGDPSVLAVVGPADGIVYLSSKAVNPAYDSISLAATASNTADLTVTTNGAYLTGGNAATIAPNTVVEVDYSGAGTGLADGTVSSASCAPANTNLVTVESTPLPTSLPSNCSGTTPQGSVQVFMDGVPTPLFMVSPTQVKAVVPYEFVNRSTASLYVRTVHASGQVTITTAQPIIVAPANPGFFFAPSSTPLPPAYQPQHQTGNPSVSLSVVVSTVQPGDVATVTVNGRNYTYTVVAGDSQTTVTYNIAAAINVDPQVTATPTGAAGAIQIVARVPGAAGTGIPVSATTTPASGQTTAGLTLTVANSTTCCANNNTGAITAANPAIPNELVTLYATGLGVLQDSGDQPVNVVDGVPYTGPASNSATNSAYVNVGGVDQNVVSDGLAPGAVGVYSVQFQIPSSATADPTTPVYTAQNQFVSNTVTIPVGTSPANQSAISASPNPIVVPTGQTTGSTVISWSTTATTNALLETNTGTVLQTGTSGSGLTVTVSDGAVYDLIDANTGAQLAALTIRVVQTQPSQAGSFATQTCPAADGGFWTSSTATSFTAQPSYIQLAGTQTYGQTDLVWTIASPSVKSVGIFRGSDPSPHFTGTANGQVETVANVTDGEIFWLQDITSSTPGNTLGCVRVAVLSEPAPVGSVRTNPSVITSTTGSGETTLSWHCPQCASAQVREGSAMSGSVVGTGVSGSTTVTATNGTIFYLVNTTNPSSPIVVSQFMVRVQRPRARLAPRPLGPSGPSRPH